MLPGDLVDGDVTEFTTTVLVNGVERAIESWSIDGELHGDLPAAVESAAGVTQRTGTVRWAQAADVQDRPVHPFRPASGWTPKPGDRVQVYVSDGVTSFPQFTGRVDKTTGSMTDGDAVSSLIDDYDNLSVPFGHPCINRAMPPRVIGDPYMYIETSPMHYLVAAARAAGYINYPAPVNMMVDAPLQGSTWPVRGRVTMSEKRVADPADPSPDVRSDAPYGWAMTDFDAFYAPDVEVSSTDRLLMSVHAGAGHTAGGGVSALFGSDLIQLWVTGARVAELSVNNVVILSRPLGDGYRAAAFMHGTSLGLWTEDGNTAWTTGTMTAFPAGPLTRFRAVADPGAQLWGATWSRPDVSLPAQTSLTPNLVLDVSSFLVTAGIVGRAIEGSTVAETLDDISKALLLATYFDGQGRLTIRSSDRLATAAPAKTVTTEQDVFALDWESNLLSQRSSVVVEGDRAAQSVSRWHNLQVADGSGDQMEDGDKRQDFITVPTDQDWILYPDNPPVNAETGGFNSGRGSFYGSSVTADGSTYEWGTAYTTVTWEQISSRTWLIGHTVSGVPAGSKVVLQTPENAATALWPKYQGYSLPVIRTGGLFEFTRAQTTPATTGAIGPALTHDIKHWAGWATDDPTMAIRFRDYIADRVTAPEPEITGLDVAFDPRLELGDVIDIQSTEWMGVTLRVLITGVSADAGTDYGLALKCRVISVTVEGSMTYAEFNAIAPTPLTYSQFNAEGDQTYAAFNAA